MHRLTMIVSHTSSPSVFILSAVRTPIGSFSGCFTSYSAVELGSVAVKIALERINRLTENESMERKQEMENNGNVDALYMGCVVTGGLGQAPARQVARKVGLKASVCCTTVNKVCASGLKSVVFGAQDIMLKQANVVVVGGMESMSNIPYYLPMMRTGMKIGDGKVVDGLMFDGLTDPYTNSAMGLLTEGVVKKFGITREQQDAFARRSYELAQKSAGNETKWEIAAVGNVERDEEPTKARFEKFPILKPAFEKNGTITAANSSKLSDGAAALVLASESAVKDQNLKPIAKILAFADAEVEPENFAIAPSSAIPIALSRAKLKIQDIDAFEINEAFAAVAIANMQILGIDESKINQFGGAVSLGHPLGCSGARIVVTCLNVLRATKKRYGCVAICNGGGGATAMIIESLM